ncbi:MAG: arginase family protein [Bacilli bacterium]
MNETHFRGLLTTDLSAADVTITGIPFDKNASIGKGASLAPDHIRELSVMIPPLSMEGYIINKIKLFDNGNILDEDFSKIKEKANNLYNNKKFNIVLGGDHSISIPLEQAFYDYALSIGKEPVIIHIDAHPDICDVYEDNKFSHACPNKRSLDYGYKDENVTLIGIRGVEEQEALLFQNHPEIDVFKTTDVKTLGPDRLVQYLKGKYSNPKYIVYLSYDIDANDPSFAPGTGTPEPFGLTNFEVLDIILGLFKNLNIGTFDIVEVSPKLDTNDITSYLAIKTLYEVLYLLQLKK